jgi:hypothetical protein
MEEDQRLRRLPARAALAVSPTTYAAPRGRTDWRFSTHTYQREVPVRLDLDEESGGDVRWTGSACRHVERRSCVG